MKICTLLNRNIDVGFSRPRKCGIETVLGIGGLGLGVADMFMQDATNQSNYAFAASENQKNRNFQHSENLAERDWQENFWKEQFDAQRAEWYRQQNYQYAENYDQFRRQSILNNIYYERQQQFSADLQQDYWLQQQDYLSPVNQMKRFSEAGLNGAALIGGTPASSPGLSAAPVSSGSVPTNNVGMGSVGTPTSPLAATGGSIGSQALNPMASFIDSVTKLSEAAEKSAHSKEIWKLIEPKIRNYMSNSEMQAAYAAGARLDIEIKSSKLPKELKKLDQEILSEIARQEMNWAITGVYDEEKVNKILERSLMWSQKYKLDEDTALVHQQVLWYGKEAKQRIATQKAQQRNFEASASLNSALAKTENELRAGRVTGLQLSNQLSTIQRDLGNINLDIEHSVKFDRIHAIVTECERSGLINKQMSEEIRRLEINNDWQGVQNFFGCLQSAASSVSGIGNMAINGWSAVQRNKVQQQFNKLYGQHVDAYRNDVVGRHNYTEDVYPAGPGGVHREHFGAPWIE